MNVKDLKDIIEKLKNNARMELLTTKKKAINDLFKFPKLV